MMLLPGSARRDYTRTAGAVEFCATLTWRTPEEMPSTSILASLSGSGSVELSLTETDDKDDATRRVSGEILALDEPSMSLVLDHVLRAVSNTATLTGAILETRVVRRAIPRELFWKTSERMARHPAWEEMPHTP